MSASLPPPSSSPEPEVSSRRARHFARRRRRRRIRRVLMLAAGCVLTVLIIWAKPVERYKAFMDDRALIQAQAAAETADWETARERSSAVLASRGRDAVAGWIYFSSLHQLKRPGAVEAGAWLLVQDGLSPDQKFRIMGVLAGQGPVEVFLRGRATLTAQEREETRFRLLQARVLTRTGSYAAAETLLRYSAGLNEEPDALVELVRVLCRKGGARDLTEAWQIFRRLKRENRDEEALKAMRLIVAVDHPGAMAGAEPAIAVWINQLPEAAAPDLLLARDFDILQKRTGEREALDSVVTGSGAASADARFSRDPGAVGRWLTRRGYPDEAIALLAGPATADPQAFAALAGAYIKAAELKPETRASRLLAAQDLLKHAPRGMDPLGLEMVRIDVARARKNEAGEDEAWKAALAAVEVIQEYDQGFALAEKARQMGRSDRELDASAAALRQPRGTLPTWDLATPVIAALAGTGRLAEILQICRNLGPYEPDNIAMRNNQHYLELLLGEVPPGAAVPVFEGLLRQSPETAEVTRSLALAYLLNNQPADAIRVIEGLPGQPGPPVQKTLLGMGLFLSGQTAKAEPLLTGFPGPGLLDREVQVLQSLLPGKTGAK